MSVQKKPQGLDDLLKKKESTPETKVVKEEKVEEYVDPEGMRDGVRIGTTPPNEVQRELDQKAGGEVHVWEETPEHNLAKTHPDFEPQKMSPDSVGYADE